MGEFGDGRGGWVGARAGWWIGQKEQSAGSQRLKTLLLLPSNQAPMAMPGAATCSAPNREPSHTLKDGT